MVAIIYAHPNPNSFNNAIKGELTQLLNSKGRSYQLREYPSAWTSIPCLRFRTMAGIPASEPRALPQRHLYRSLSRLFNLNSEGLFTLCKHIFHLARLSKPIGCAHLQRYHGIAYNKEPNLSTNSMTSPSGMEECLRKTTEKGIFESCGIRVVEHIFLYAVPYVGDEERKNMLIQVRKALEVLL